MNTSNLNNSLLKACLDILKKEEVIKEIKILIAPLIDLILYQLYPYIYVIVFVIIFMFILILAILVLLILLIHNKGF